MLIYVHESGENLSPGQGQGGRFPGRRITVGDGGAESLWRAPKVPTRSHVLSSMQYICFRKTAFANMGRQTCFLPLAPS